MSGAEPQDMEPANPFAPIQGGKPAKPKVPPEVWEPQMPAPQEPPAPADMKLSGYGRAARGWTYRDVAGAPLFAVYRFEKTEADGTTSKETLPASYGRREWTAKSGRKAGEVVELTGWHYKAPAAPRPLYGLDRLAHRPAAPVLVVEGEKAADAAGLLFPDCVVVASQGGSKAAGKSDWSPLAGRTVTFWPDRDAAGVAYAATAGRLAEEAGAASIALVPVPDTWPEGWDLADPLPADATAGTLGEMLCAATAFEVEDVDSGEDDEAPATSAEAAVEIERLSLLPRSEYAMLRKRAAQTLGIGVGALDGSIARAKGRRRAEAQAAHRARPAPEAGETEWPLGILSRDDGLFYDPGEDALPIWLCGPLDVLGHGRDGAGEGWGLFLRWRDRDGRAHSWLLPSRLLYAQPGEMEGAFADRGLVMSAEPANRGHLRKAFAEVKSGTRVATVEAPGWVAGTEAYVLPHGEVVGQADEPVVLKAMAENAASRWGSKGTLTGWQDHVAAKAEGNPIAAFAVCSAFAGPLLGPMGESSGGVHIFGRSKAGKTLAIRLGLSVQGSTRKGGLLRDWRSTANALEGAAEESNDSLLTLDEVHQCDPKEVVGAIYQLANEGGKSRLTREAVSRKRRTWTCIILSTGEVDIATMAMKAGPTSNLTPLPAGADVRLPSIPIDGRDMWPALHNASSAAALMAELQQSLLAHYGTAIGPYLAELVKALAEDAAGLIEALDVQRTAFLAHLPPDADPQVREVVRRFALIAFAGEIAIEWGILPWQEGAATAAAVTVLAMWLGRREGTGATEESQHVTAVRAYLSEFGASRFVALEYRSDEDDPMGKPRWRERHPDRPMVSRSGWRRASSYEPPAEQADEAEHGPRGDEYLLDRDGWAKMCAASGADPHEVAKTLAAAGHLEPGDGKNLAKSTRLPSVGKTRVYVVRPSIFEGQRRQGRDAA